MKKTLKETVENSEKHKADIRKLTEKIEAIVGNPPGYKLALHFGDTGETIDYEELIK